MKNINDIKIGLRAKLMLIKPHARPIRNEGWNNSLAFHDDYMFLYYDTGPKGKETTGVVVYDMKTCNFILSSDDFNINLNERNKLEEKNNEYSK